MGVKLQEPTPRCARTKDMFGGALVAPLTFKERDIVDAGVTRRTKSRSLGGGAVVRRSFSANGQNDLDLFGGARNVVRERDAATQNVSDPKIRGSAVEIKWSHFPEERAAALELYQIKYGA